MAEDKIGKKSIRGSSVFPEKMDSLFRITGQRTENRLSAANEFQLMPETSARRFQRLGIKRTLVDLNLPEDER